MRDHICKCQFKNRRSLCINYDLFIDTESHMMILKYFNLPFNISEHPFTTYFDKYYIYDKELFDLRSRDIQDWKNYTQECVK